GQPELLEERLVERPLDLQRPRRVLVEHDDPRVSRRARGSQRERTRELAQVERVLHGVELETLTGKRPIGEPAQEGMAKDRRVDRLDPTPQLIGEGHGRMIRHGEDRPCWSWDSRARWRS